MINSVIGELIVLGRRPATWIILAIWIALSSIFGYGWGYVAYLSNSANAQVPLVRMLPESLVGTMVEGYPFFGGVLALILGVLIFGSEYGWGTLKTLYMQRASRLSLLGAKVIALEVVLLAFVIAGFLTGAVWSLLIAINESATVTLPSVSLLARGIGAAWIVLSAWAAFGVLLGVASRGTAMAIGFGVLYGLAVESILVALAQSVDFLEPLVSLFIRSNGYSLIQPLGIDIASLRDRGPGSFAGPYVDPMQALAVLVLYVAVFVGVTAVIVRQRDVT